MNFGYLLVRTILVGGAFIDSFVIYIIVWLFFTEINSTKATEAPVKEDVLYQKDVSFSAELEVAPSTRVSHNIKHIDTTVQPSKEEKRENYSFTGEKSKELDGLKSLIEDGVSKADLNIISDGVSDIDKLKVTTLGPSLEQKVLFFT